MAEDDQDLELDLEESEESEGGLLANKKLIIIIAGAVLLVVVLGLLAFFIFGSDSQETDEEEVAEEVVVKEKGPAIYVGVPNAITANLPGRNKNRTVQIKMTFLVRSSDAARNVAQHMPQLKNDVLMLVSQKNAEELRTPGGVETLKREALTTVQKSLKDLVNDPSVEKVLFISFVMQ